MASPVRTLMSLPPLARRMFLGLLLSSLGSGLTLPFLFVYLTQVRGFATSTVGLVMASTGVVAFATVPFFGSVIDRMGPRPVLLASLVLEAVGVTLVAEVRTVPQAFMLAAAIAAGGSGIWPAGAALLTRLVPEGLRQTAYGVQFMLLNAGLGIGGLVAALIVDLHDASSFERLYRIDGVTYLGYVVVVALMPRGTGTYVPEPQTDDRPGGGWAEVLHDKTLVAVTAISALAVTCGYAQMETGYAAYVVTVARVDPKVLGVAYGANTAVIVLGQLVALRFLEARSRTRMLAIAAAGWSSAWVVVALCGVVPGIWAAAAAVAGLGLFGAAETLWSPVAPALVNALAPERLRGRYNALSGMTWTVSSVVGPSVAGLLIGNGLAALWVLVTVGGTACAALGFLALGRRIGHRQDGVAPQVSVVGGVQD